MIKKLSVLMTLLMLSGSVFALGCGGEKHKDKHYKKHKKHKEHKEYKKHKKHKKHKEFKAKAPEVTFENAKKSVGDLTKFVFRAAFDKDFDKVKKIVLTEEEGKAFAKPDFFKKYVNSEKMTEKFSMWKENASKSKFLKVKTDDKEKFTFKPGDKNEKFKELIENITKEVTVWQAKVIAKMKDKKLLKCSLVALKLKDDDWRLIRVKDCKITDKKKKAKE
ncbi:MAG: hypothetical protein JXR95_10775 [Deltaproteobacteria bacterium]|nr:hypothetical protein [Deltaproteobacteria bacterium]